MKKIISGLIFAVISLNANAVSFMDQIEIALNGDHREPLFVARDIYRHPLETLKFMGLEPEMTVVEIWPAIGWYTEILAPFTRARGIMYAASFAITADRTPDWRKEMHKGLMEKMEQRPDVYDHVVVTELSIPERTTIAPPGSADIVLTFRNVHNWMKGEYAETMFNVFYKTLKSGGLLGIVEHRAKPGTSLEQMIKTGYVTTDHVIKLAEDAGFLLEEMSEINANPKDTINHPEGVWTLPPSLRHCKKMEEGTEKENCFTRYISIGESDRMTLRFRKP